ncbi:MAG TPA: hypothetical protein VLL52_25465 [Anaerolineae bacterium]|nr:hypothetical protein [Anaerolineae bacterium]
MKKLYLLLLILIATACSPTIAAVTPIPEEAEPAAVNPLFAPATATIEGALNAPLDVSDPLADLSTRMAEREAYLATRATLPTPTPLSIRMAQEETLAIMRATDTAIQPTPVGDLIEFTDADEPVELHFGEFYQDFDPVTGWILSDRLVSLDGKVVEMYGFMAPPLKLELNWFQLTGQRVGSCSFCSSATDVAEGTVLVYPTEDLFFTLEGVRVIGRLEVGAAADPQTGMVSLARIYAEDIDIVQP